MSPINEMSLKKCEDSSLITKSHGETDEIKYIKNDQVEDMVKKAGFKDVTVTGNKGEEEGQYGHMSIVKPFDPLSSEWMTVIAYK